MSIAIVYFSAFFIQSLWAACNILDQKLTDKMQLSYPVIIFCSHIISLIFMPFLLLLNPGIPSEIQFYILCTVLAFLGVIYVFPYYMALRREDTSVVTSYFELGNIFIPFLSYLIVGEVLSTQQYVGFFIIILCALFMSFRDAVKMQHASSLALMIGVTFILSLEAVLYKYTLNLYPWADVYTWTTLIGIAISLPIVLFGRYQSGIVQAFKPKNGAVQIMSLEQLSAFVASVIQIYILSILPVTVYKAIGATQQFFVLLFAVLLHKKFPKSFKEKISKRDLYKKTILFTIMIFGVLLVLFP